MLGAQGSKSQKQNTKKSVKPDSQTHQEEKGEETNAKLRSKCTATSSKPRQGPRNSLNTAMPKRTRDLVDEEKKRLAERAYGVVGRGLKKGR